ncbi:MAG: TonB-dependent receptor [Bryobacteraceae bacterium]
MQFRAGVFCLIALSAWAQTERGNITGVVTDPSGAAVPGASLTIINTANNLAEHVTSTSAGDYNAANLSPGVYRVDATAAGFKHSIQNDVTLTAAGTVRLDMVLQVGQVNETVEVAATAAQIQTENAKISTAVENKLVDDLPLVVGGAMRSPYNLVSIVPEAKGSGSSISLGGGQAASWNATLDGISATTNRSADAGEIAYISPSVEALTEFTVDTNGFKAEYGQAGGGVITFVSKSGSNQFHGVGYDFLRNDDLDARGFFAPTRSIYKQNDFGATAGGPVILPKIYNGRNKTFFFVSYEGFRNRVGSNGVISSVPTPEMYKGDFSNWVDQTGKLLQIYDPATTRPNPSGSGYIRDPFAGNQVPLSRFSTVSQQMIPFAEAVKPNIPGLIPGTSAYVRNNYVTSNGTTLSPTDKGSLKIDQQIGSNQRAGFFYNRTSYRNEVGPDGPPGLPEPLWNGQVSQYDASVYRFSHDWTISARLLNHFYVGGNKFIKNSYSPNVGQNWKSKVCIQNVVDCNVNFPNVSFSEFTSWGSTAYNGTEQPQWSIGDDLSYIRGAHTMKFGYSFESQRANGFGQQNISGHAGFNFLETGVPAATGFTSGSSFASFLLGAADSGNTETVRFVGQTFDYHGFYAQDDWHITRRLTMNLGLRYEFTQPPVESKDQYTDFTPTLPNPAVNNYPGALRFAGFGPGRQNTRSLVPGWYGAWGPRLGLAYAPNEKTTFRAGFARSFSKVSVVSGSDHYEGFIGQYSFSSQDQGITPAFYFNSGLPPYPLPPQIDPSFQNNQNVDFWNYKDATRAPEDLNWTFSMQRQVSPNTVIEAAYNAVVGAHLQAGLLNLNQVPTAIYEQLLAQYGPPETNSLLVSNINSAQARAANIPIPYPNFTNSTIQHSQSVNQALRPFPQYLTIQTADQGGDKSGHSNYQAFVLKADRRLSGGLIFQWSYTFSKLLTNADTYYANTGLSEDQYNRGLEKSIGEYDQTHVVKLSTVYELPFGRGKRWLTHGFANQVLGGWRLSANQIYASGFPLAVTRNNPLPIFNGQDRPVITSYEGWRAAATGGFDPHADLFYDKNAFPAQPNYGFGNATRYNPKVRAFPTLNEDVSLGKSFNLTESRHIDFRAEAFNLFNRTVFGNPDSNLNSKTFGVVSSQANSPRQMQLALKLYW